MRNVTRVLFLIAAAAVLAFAPSAMADSTMTLTGAGSNGATDGVYIGPYTATINGTSTPVICDDFAAETFLNESWTASVTNLGTVAGGAPGFNSGTGTYSDAAWLTLQLLSAPNKSTAAAIQYAIWDLFDPSGVSAYLTKAGDTALLNSVANWVNLAEGSNGGASLTASQLADFLIYTPTGCVSGQCLNGAGLPQEFIVYTPEPSAILMLVIGLIALFWFKRRERLSNPA